MKKFYVLNFFLCCLFVQQAFSQNRYIDKVFTDEQIVRIDDIEYNTNMTVFPQIFVPGVDVPVPEMLLADIWMPDPAIDTVAERPIVLLPAGLILPRGIISCSGDKKDAQHLYSASELAKRGYVVMSFNMRTGANLFAPTSEAFLNSLGSWGNRQAIDSRNAIRFLKKDAAENGNTYGVNVDQVIHWDMIIGGSGKGQYTNSFDELNTPNYFVLDTLGNFVNIVDTLINGGIYGINPGMDAAGNVSNIPSNTEYFEQYPYDLVIGFMGGAQDTFTVQAGEPPLIIYNNRNFPTATTEIAPVTVPATGTFCCNQFTGQVILRQHDALGNQDVWKGVEFSDPVANFREPYPADPSRGPVEGLISLAGDPANSSPWIFWDTTTCLAIEAATMNEGLNARDLDAWRGMTPELGMARMDSIMRYWTPRACVLFGWDCGDAIVGGTTSTENVSVAANFLNISPNPSSGYFTFESSPEFPMERIQIFNVSGALLYETRVDNTQFTLNDIGLTGGMYIAKISFEDGIATKKIVVER